MSDSQALTEFGMVTAQGQTVLRQSESETVTPYPVSVAAADLSLASLPGVDAQPKVPASVSSDVNASLALSTVSAVTDSLTSSHAPVGVVSLFTPVGGVLSSMLSVRESRAAAELERMHTGLGALSYAAEFVERADASFAQKEYTSCGGAMRSDVELTVRGDDARSDSSDDGTLELSPQVTVRGPVTGHTGPPAMATTSYYDLSLAASGPSMFVTSRCVDLQRERPPPIRSAFSATGMPTVAYDRSVSPNSLRCDEEVSRISASVASPPRPRTSSAPDSPSRCDVNVSIGGTQHRSPPPAFSAWPHASSHVSSRAQSLCTVTDVRS